MFHITTNQDLTKFPTLTFLPASMLGIKSAQEQQSRRLTASDLDFDAPREQFRFLWTAHPRQRQIIRSHPVDTALQRTSNADTSVLTDADCRQEPCIVNLARLRIGQADYFKLIDCIVKLDGHAFQ